jgi:hypothetical protein
VGRAPQQIYRQANDSTIVYTNVPPAGPTKRTF